MKLFLVLILSSISFNAFCFQNVDSLTYALQRNKINSMLDARSEKFGQFELSLQERTGFFGLKTKKDMGKSISILTQIVQTDNDILHETKTLLDYKTYQQEAVASKSLESESRNMAYMRTINKLQTENEKAHTEIAEYKKGKKFYQIVSFALGLAIISFALFVFRKILRKG